MVTVTRKAAKSVAAKKPCWIRFMAPVVPPTVNALFQSIDQAIGTGADHLHLMLSSPGGSVFHGLSAHNYLRGLAIPITTYNFGSVDSIGVVIFCSGSERICVPHARFLIHSVSLNFSAQSVLDEKGLEEHLKSVRPSGRLVYVLRFRCMLCNLVSLNCRINTPAVTPPGATTISSN